MQKKFFAVATFALAFAVAFSASAYDLGSTTLKKGSKGAAVVELQKALNACNAAGISISTDGSFGSGTQSAVKAFQTSKNLTADGKVGAMSKAALNSCTTSSSTSTSTSTSSNWSNSSAEGYLATIEADSANKVSTVYESEQDKVVAGFRGTAKLADQKIEKVTVKFHQTATAASANLGNYISSVSLWNGSSKIATMSVADADRSNLDDTYTFNFTGLNSVIAKDAVGRFYVSVNVNGSIDSTYASNSKFYVNVSDIRSTSPNGVYNNYQPAGLAIGADTVNAGGLSFAKYSASGVKATVTRAQSSPLAYTQTVSKTAVTNGVKLLDFNVKAEVSSVTLRNLPITISSSAAPSDFINTVKLMKGSDVVGDLAPSTGSTYTLTNLNTQFAKVAAGTTATYSIVVDLKNQGATYGNYANGTTVSAAITSVAAGQWSVIDSNGDQLVSRSGGATGYVVTLGSVGAAISYVSESYTPPVTGTSTADGLISITMNVTAFGGDLTINTDGSNITSKITNGPSSNTATVTTVDTTVSVGNLVASGGAFTITDGDTQQVTLSKLFNSKTGFAVLSVSSVAGSPASNIKTTSH